MRAKGTFIFQRVHETTLGMLCFRVGITSTLSRLVSFHSSVLPPPDVEACVAFLAFFKLFLPSSLVHSHFVHRETRGNVCVTEFSTEAAAQGFFCPCVTDMLMSVPRVPY